MGVAEGVETALSAAYLFAIPVWAAVSAGSLAEWVPPDCARRVTIFGDNDASFTGQAAAFRLAQRLRAKGLKVQVDIPDPVDSDWNDILQQTERAA
ncbi:toprim domain-containing protein [Lichenifustis flavocetrariae]|uniref:Toprim domain-containing protein n=1 Tax=Lichenifustis flavocetrariae TaxID=2949735 RepID=A0AA41Z108_9HYPH|nr:toprim domain-containing protein [Lichenifustis flavocetrariae]MCW6510972.1 toprim domain-containing protein [Lichenifustis flavocetrariae]